MSHHTLHVIEVGTRFWASRCPVYCLSLPLRGDLAKPCLDAHDIYERITHKPMTYLGLLGSRESLNGLNVEYVSGGA